uniref:Uncharacterized protein n=1 Tax=Rhizophora mucronata TaxID=61149 RepID=A0A2P2Q1W9_RHIMU
MRCNSTKFTDPSLNASISMDR